MLFIRLITCIYLRMPFKCLEKRASKLWRHWAEQCNNLIKVCQTFWHCSFKSGMMRSRAWAPLYMMSTPSYSVRNKAATQSPVRDCLQPDRQFYTDNNPVQRAVTTQSADPTGCLQKAYYWRPSIWNLVLISKPCIGLLLFLSCSST